MKAVVKVIRNYQVTILIRNKSSIRVGDKLEVTVVGSRIIMRKLSIKLPEVNLGYLLSPSRRN
ncbi:MAG: AbrB/MazE/SpoVT family DNA-binding domain-containing protein [Sulfolobus sp.]|nr:AbrB/MazE/SpoVT family DNA-binding domain-containing protein [Sulfolobus sp.]